MEDFKNTENKIESESYLEKVNHVLKAEKELKTQNEKTHYISLYFYEQQSPDNVEFLLTENSHFDYFYNTQSNSKGGLEDELSLECEMNEIKKQTVDLYKEKGLLGLITESKKKTQKKFNSFFVKESRKKKEIGNIFGTLEFDDASHIHFNKIENKEDKKSIEESFSLLCDHLASKDILPFEIKADSWIMGSAALRKKIGFDVVYEREFTKKVDFTKNENINLGIALWGQFIDKNGNYNKKNIEYLFKNGEPKYKQTLVKISTKKIFEKYGTKYKGQEFEVENSDRKVAERELEFELENSKLELEDIFNHADYETFYNFLSKKKIWKNFIHTDVAPKFFGILKKAHKEGKKFKAIKATVSEEVLEEFESTFAQLEEDYLNTFNNDNEKFILD